MRRAISSSTPGPSRRWLGVRSRWTLAVCEVDLRVVGAYRGLAERVLQAMLKMHKIEISELERAYTGTA